VGKGCTRSCAHLPDLQKNYHELALWLDAPAFRELNACLI
jgi:hypothetical protein